MFLYVEYIYFTGCAMFFIPLSIFNLIGCFMGRKVRINPLLQFFSESFGLFILMFIWPLLITRQLIDLKKMHNRKIQ
ncbi:hypothetical protein CN515_05500 [Bacillus cereus]|nr:hypothetical protein CN515_05500 [Bacillus cereus]